MAKYREEYQITNPMGEPVGPPQVFEADTKDELIEKLKAAHKNAASKFYEAKRAAKLGSLLEPDPEQPIQTFEERPLTADERTRIATDLTNPARSVEAARALVESVLGAPVGVIRENLRETELMKRKQFIAEQVDVFKGEHPEYVECNTNRDLLIKYLTKKGWPVTAKNLEIAFNDLAEDGLLILRAPETKVVTPEPAKVDPQSVQIPPTDPQSTVVQTAPQVGGNTADPSKAAEPISSEPAVVQPKASASSSGLRRSDSSVGTGGTAAPKTAGITLQEIHAMTSEQYVKRLNSDPEFARQVKELFDGIKA